MNHLRTHATANSSASKGLSKHRKSVSAIVPVFNEEKTVKNVVNILLKHPLIDEVLCIDDGSKDSSLQILKQLKDDIVLIHLAKNYGKGYALAQGIRLANGEIVVFIDADLVRFKSSHIDNLLDPILRGHAQAVLGYPMPSKNHLFASLSRNNTGERAYYKRDLMPHLAYMTKTRFGVEVYLNYLFKRRKIKKVPLLHLTHLFKHEKYTTQKALKEYIKMGVEITEELGKREGLLPKDYQTLKTLTKITDFREIKLRVNDMNNKKIRLMVRRVFTELLLLK